MRRLICLLAVSIAASGCTKISEMAMAVPAKINAAFPPNAEVRVAEENLRATLQQDSAATKAFDEQYTQRMDLRALTCSQGLSIGRFDSLDAVKTQPVDRECLKKQDEQLLQYLGLRQIALLLAKPPLRPLKPLGAPAAVPSIDGVEIYSGVAAPSAGVAVLRGTRGELISIEIPGGKKIATLPNAPEYGQQMLLSPNGRIAAVQINNNGLLFVDTETGNKLWDTKEINQFHAWIPETSAAIATQSKTGNLMSIDFNAAKIENHPVTLRYATWALPVGGSRVLIGSSRNFILADVTRQAGSLTAAIIKEFNIKQGQGVTSTRPTLMMGGKAIVFISSRDFMMVDLESGQETLWSTGDFLGNRYAKLSETTLLVDSHTPGSMNLSPQIFDIQHATLAPVETDVGKFGIVAALDGRTGFMRRGNGMWFGDELKAGEPAALDGLLAAFNLERQLAKLEAERRAAELSAGSGYPATPYAYPPVAPAAPAAASAPNPLISALTKDAQIEAIGVYQGRQQSPSSAGGNRSMGNVEVRVRRSLKPIVLVLSSYEPVRWTVVPEPGAKVLAVLVSGYYPSQVVGAGSARIINTGGTYAYKQGSSEYQSLNRETMKWTGRGIDIFQGRYESASFSVGG